VLLFWRRDKLKDLPLHTHMITEPRGSGAIRSR
jgi:hypothetical protein